ncbi:hypothetical protein GCM10027034_14210 [Ramlibacter solisilvae]
MAQQPICREADGMASDAPTTDDRSYAEVNFRDVSVANDKDNTVRTARLNPTNHPSKAVTKVA